jgi:hypothetical protein
MDTTSDDRCVTLAGDTSQRLLMDNGFTDWRGVLKDLGLAGVEVEPLRIGYRSTLEVLAFARAVDAYVKAHFAAWCERVKRDTADLLRTPVLGPALLAAPLTPQALSSPAPCSATRATAKS